MAWKIYKNLEIVEDPTYLAKQAGEEISKAWNEAKARLNIDGDELERRIKNKYAHAYRRLEREQWARINSDTYAKYEDGTLTQSDMERWKDALDEWKAGWIRLLEKVGKEKIE